MSEGTTTDLECPRDRGITLVAVDRNGVTVDACPSCRGIWLDRGELEKLIELEARATDDFLDEIKGSSHRGEGTGEEKATHGAKKRKRGSLLGDIFDFG